MYYFWCSCKLVNWYMFGNSCYKRCAVCQWECTICSICDVFIVRINKTVICSIHDMFIVRINKTVTFSICDVFVVRINKTVSPCFCLETCNRDGQGQCDQEILAGLMSGLVWSGDSCRFQVRVSDQEILAGLKSGAAMTLVPSTQYGSVGQMLAVCITSSSAACPYGVIMWSLDLEVRLSLVCRWEGLLVNAIA